MATALARFSPAPEAARHDLRKASRPGEQRHGRLSSPQEENASVVISDVSAHGCAVQHAPGCLRPGGFVSIGLEDGAPLQAIVRWVRQDRAGLEFLRAVPRASAPWQALIALDS